MLREKIHIYIVDDDESVCRALSLLLGTYEFRVYTYTSAEQFFSSVPTDATGCLILDIHMPGLDGWGTFVRIKKVGFNIPVVVITADKNGGLRDRALGAGAIGFLQKPLSEEALVDLINFALSKKKEGGENNA